MTKFPKSELHVVLELLKSLYILVYAFIYLVVSEVSIEKKKTFRDHPEFRYFSAFFCIHGTKQQMYMRALITCKEKLFSK